MGLLFPPENQILFMDLWFANQDDYRYTVIIQVQGEAALHSTVRPTVCLAQYYSKNFR